MMGPWSRHPRKPLAILVVVWLLLTIRLNVYIPSVKIPDDALTTGDSRFDEYIQERSPRRDLHNSPRIEDLTLIHRDNEAKSSDTQDNEGANAPREAQGNRESNPEVQEKQESDISETHHDKGPNPEKEQNKESNPYGMRQYQDSNPETHQKDKDENFEMPQKKSNRDIQKNHQMQENKESNNELQDKQESNNEMQEKESNYEIQDKQESNNEMQDKQESNNEMQDKQESNNEIQDNKEPDPRIQDNEESNLEIQENREMQEDKNSNSEMQENKESNREVQNNQESNPELQEYKESNPEMQKNTDSKTATQEENSNPDRQEKSDSNPEMQESKESNPETQGNKESKPEMQENADSNREIQEIMESNPGTQESKESNREMQEKESNPETQGNKESKPEMQENADSNREIQESNPEIQETKESNREMQEKESNPEKQGSKESNPEIQENADSNRKIQETIESNHETQGSKESNPETQGSKESNPETQGSKESNREVQEKESNPETQGGKESNPGMQENKELNSEVKENKEPNAEAHENGESNSAKQQQENELISEIQQKGELKPTQEEKKDVKPIASGPQIKLQGSEINKSPKETKKRPSLLKAKGPVLSHDLDPSEVLIQQEEISTLKARIETLNLEQRIFNTHLFGPVTASTTILLVQVHKRLEYLTQLVESMKGVRGINDTLVVFSHDFWDDHINAFVQNISEFRVMQMFLPYSMQLHPAAFPGRDPRDCVWNMPRDSDQDCLNKAWPDKYGHYREPQFTQIKHHWWWKINRVFDELRVTKGWTGVVLSLEEDHYLLPDTLHVLNLLLHQRPSVCPTCHVIGLGNYQVKKALPEKMLMGDWPVSGYNLGYTLDRHAWETIKKLSDVFCTYDDYNWDLTLSYMALQRIQPRLGMLRVELSRVAHIGTCGTHFKAATCNIEREIEKVRLKYDATKLFPTNLVLQGGYSKVKGRSTPSGGWGDARDIQLCKLIAQGASGVNLTAILNKEDHR
ncbi:glutamic acid-rich protein isoform X2 [Penaeus vannamei]|uniref:glutamic acid-rich protein isoform X2 n=1 Tax=Penaeus vannamei TaxID=6689 RepID=UPI00387F3FEA